MCLEIDEMFKTTPEWANRIMLAEAIAYQDNLRTPGLDYVELKKKYINYVLEKYTESIKTYMMENTSIMKALKHCFNNGLRHKTDWKYIENVIKKYDRKV